MRCDNCNRNIEKDFNYCPYCGTRIRKGFFSMFQSLFDRKRTKPMKGLDSPFSEFPMMKGGITIKVTGPKGTKIRRIPLKQTSSQKKVPVKRVRKTRPQMQKKAKPPKKLVEPEASLNKKDGRFILEFKLPEIKDPKDINIMKFPNSLEIRARIKDKMYFKLMKLPKKLSIIKKSFDKGVLTVEMKP